ncbi:DUF4013 domain-containing protein [bacterium]|uniref:Glycerophosphoryl diester phosphodiesterase membrane domain-containing protein n=1 Tax=Huberarchaeum crystalense TaxID=2014257 RepID=A0A2H9RED8_HUBC1|nr:DUF4013 domain-containing protein [archaeon]OIP20177.1 MAG: hypothetical protein AUJ91_01960 [archaeon CG2_30_31_98]PJC01780.1 MAG: hypothetical protein CO072_00030 [Candidatus Huberarchaeum crystalense]
MVVKKKAKKTPKVAKSRAKGDVKDVVDFPIFIQNPEVSKSEVKDNISIRDILKAPFTKENRKQLLVVIWGVFLFSFSVLLVLYLSVLIKGWSDDGLFLMLWGILFIVVYIFVYIIILGYAGRWLKNILNKNLDLPSWENKKGLIKVGFGIFIVYLAYYLPFYIVYFIFMLALGIKSSAFIVIDTIMIPLLFVALLPFIMIAIIRFIYKEQIKDAFKLKEVLVEFRSKSLDYIVACILCFVVICIVVVALIFLVVLTSLFVRYMALIPILVVNTLLGSILNVIMLGLFFYIECVFSVYLYLIIFGLFGRVYAQSQSNK